ncbi:MFS transporter [Mycobacterium uberis]|uniref:MFS transporter n=1 Tax=Mycobacterium uberis TaxID=2162698 RepID=UPI000E308290|nr:MFS transporter [Mycobacterium uberis]
MLLGETCSRTGIRAAALGVAAARQRAANWYIAVTFPALRNMLSLVYVFYALCMISSLLFVWRWGTETKDKLLKDTHREI